MNIFWRYCLAIAAGSVFAFLVTFSYSAYGAEKGQVTALEEYVFSPDPAYAWELTDTQDFPGYTLYSLLVDSLEWRSESEVDRTLWTHQVNIVVPDEVTTQTAVVLIDGGSDPLDTVDPLLLALAATIAGNSGSVLAAVSQIPNQPLLFSDQPDAISEDALVAYSWSRAASTGDAEWAAYLPMTKASVRGMDAVQEFVNGSVDGVTIDDFVVTGFSKRGATAWLVAAVDPRVRAAAPGVFDILNMPVQIERHWEAYGFYADAIHDYEDYEIVRQVRSPEGRWLADIVDPFSYVATLDIPKLVLNSTGDQFFLPDAAQFYVGGLPGETLVRQLPNTDHGLTNGLFEALDAILAWYNTVLTGTPRPSVEWQLDGTLLEVQSDPPAKSATLWQATNEKTRDFRLETIGTAWTSSALKMQAPGSWQVQLEEPAEGWRGYMVELVFPGVDGPPDQTYTTPVFVTPDELPFVLDDPVQAPQGPRYWLCQLPETAGCPRPPVQDLDALLGFPLFGEYVTDVAQLAPILQPSRSADGQARRECLAVRLNIAAGELGWYSLVPLDNSGDRLWRHYERAEAAFADGDAGKAAYLCRSLNAGRPVLPIP